MRKGRNAFELIVVGAGPVGLLLAARLLEGAAGRRLGVRILDLKPPRAWSADAMDARVYALSRASQAAFAALGLWDRIRARRASPYRLMRVWEGADAAGRASVRFDAAEIGEPDLGHIVEDSLLRGVLLERLATAAVDLRFGEAVAGLKRRGGAVELTTTGGETYKADLVVGADGTESTIRAAARIDAIRHDYGQTALVAHVATEKPHAETAWQRFLAGGPLAFLPLGDGRSSIVWSCPADEAGHLAGLGDAAFLAALETASAGVLGRLGPISERHAFPLRLLHARRYTQAGIALIGDAAHTVHPLAGQGMNLGLGDAVCLADTLLAALREGQYPADERVLRRYERARKAHNLTMQLAFDGLSRLFGRGFPAWAGPVRGLGLALVDRTGPAKAFLTRRALGLDAAPANRENPGAA
jgi:2-octaprenylphenol hydroxylase